MDYCYEALRQAVYHGMPPEPSVAWLRDRGALVCGHRVSFMRGGTCQGAALEHALAETRLNWLAPAVLPLRAPQVPRAHPDLGTSPPPPKRQRTEPPPRPRGPGGEESVPSERQRCPGRPPRGLAAVDRGY